MTATLIVRFDAKQGNDVNIYVRSKYNLKPTKEEMLACASFSKVVDDYIKYLKKKKPNGKS